MTQPQQTESLADAALRTRLAALTALRDRVARQIDGTDSARDVAALSQRFMDVLAQIDEIGGAPSSKETGLSDFERRLRERETAAKAPRRVKSS